MITSRLVMELILSRTSEFRVGIRVLQNLLCNISLKRRTSNRNLEKEAKLF